MNPEITEYVGYAASIFVVASFLMKDLKKVRMVNLIGCICFVAYGFFNEKTLWPIIIPNAILAFIQIYNLLKKN